jgi:HEAT repeat protein
VGIVSITLGCGAAPAKKPVAAPEPKPAAVKPTATKSRPPVTPPAAVTADSFLNSAAAVEALVQAVSDSNSEEFARAQSWLVLQRASAIPAVANLMRDEAAPMFARTAACKILAQLGPEAAEPLLNASQDGRPRVQHVAIEHLGNVRPTSQQVITSLIELTQDTDNEIRLAAILGLEHVGPAASDAADVMLAILNNTSEPESLRSTAKECLLKVNPRKTFND